jgi:hypothetical protein
MFVSLFKFILLFMFTVRSNFCHAYFKGNFQDIDMGMDIGTDTGIDTSTDTGTDIGTETGTDSGTGAA